MAFGYRSLLHILALEGTKKKCMVLHFSTLQRGSRNGSGGFANEVQVEGPG